MEKINRKMYSQVYQDILHDNVRLSVHQLKRNRSWVMQQENDPKHRSKIIIRMASTEENMPPGVAQSESWPQPDWDAVAWPQREQFTPDIPRILLNWNSFVKMNGPNFLLTIVQVWSATTENIWLWLLLPKECQPVIKSKGSHTFPTLHSEYLHGVFNKDMKTYTCLCVISLSGLCLPIAVMVT